MMAADPGMSPGSLPPVQSGKARTKGLALQASLVLPTRASGIAIAEDRVNNETTRHRRRPSSKADVMSSLATSMTMRIRERQQIST